MRAVDEDNRAYTPWMPFNTPAFISLLAEALAEADVTSRTRRDLVFLDIGCGPGPKMLVARDLFGLDAHGFDRREEYVRAACSLGLDAKVAGRRDLGRLRRGRRAVGQPGGARRADPGAGRAEDAPRHEARRDRDHGQLRGRPARLVPDPGGRGSAARDMAEAC
jgi:hypothetical protein